MAGPSPMLLALDGGANLVAGLLFLYVGRLVSHRRLSDEAAPAGRAFGFWWYGLGLTSLAGVIGTILTATQTWTFPTMVTWLHAVMLVILAAVGSLMYYLVFVYTGRRGSWRPIAALYVIIWLGVEYLIATAQPIGLCPPAATTCRSNPLSTTLAFQNDLTGTPASLVFGLSLLLPVLAAAVAYFTLFFRTTEPTPRYRIALTSLSIVCWFSFSLIGTLMRGDQAQDLGWAFLSRAVSMAATVGIFLAFRPPGWVRRRYGVEAVEPVATAPVPAVPAPRLSG